MATETELKLRIAPEHMARLKRHPFLRELSKERAVTRKLYSIYFDTPDLQLHRAEMALRLRRVGQQWLQTLKGGGAVQAGLHLRNEWETPVAGEQLDFPALEAEGAYPLSAGLRKKVRSLFVTDFTRSIRMVQFEGALIELSLDSGEIRAGENTHPISELELELKSGEPVQLFRLALALLDIVPLEIEATSKAEYGYRLYAPAKPCVSKARAPKLNLKVPVAAALQSMIWSCLFHLQANVPGAVKKTDDEYLHQVRIALRRLRVVLSMAAKHRADTELESLRALIGELGTALGRSREWDVFVTQTLPDVQKHMGSGAVLKNIVRQSEKLRQHHHQIVHTALQTGDFQRLLLRFGAWMNADYWRGTDTTSGLRHFAEKILHKRSQKVLQYGGQLQRDANAGQLHELRIACKNLRYSAEMFGSLYSQDKTERYLELLGKLQDTLGMLNDHTVALRLLKEMDQAPESGTIELIRTWVEQIHSKRLNQLRKSWGKFAGLAAFWR